MRIHLPILLLLFTVCGNAQVNLVPNYSFEELDSCPYLPDDFFVVKNWHSPNNSTPDIYNACDTSPTTSVPINWMGFQYALQGDGYAGLLLYVPNIFNYREYVGVKLISTLEANKYYCLKFYVCLAEQYPLHISSISAYFSPDSLFQNDLKVLPYTPQIENPDFNFINDTTKWQVVRGYFQAQGGEKYLYIGNFRTDANTIIDSNSSGSRSYVYIDKVELYECDSLIGIEESPAPIFKYYPNPSTGLLYIEKSSNQAGIFELFDVQGRPVYSQRLSLGVSKAEINISHLSSGLYFCRVVYEDGRMQTGKVVKQE